jgi:hypothetical protein
MWKEALQFRHWTSDDRQQTFPDRKLTLAGSYTVSIFYLCITSGHFLPLSLMSGVYGPMSESQERGLVILTFWVPCDKCLKFNNRVMTFSCNL